MKIVFVADYFAPEFVGGSEKSLEAIIQAAPAGVEIERVYAKDFARMNINKDVFIVFGNFSNLPITHLPRISEHYKYAVIESDYKACSFRSAELHKAATGNECDCHKNAYGQRISDFYSKAKVMFWKSTRQMQWYVDRFSILDRQYNVVISGTFTNEDLDYLVSLAAEVKPRHGWAALKSDSWIKGYEDVVVYMKNKGLERLDLHNGRPWKSTMSVLSRCKGIVLMPRGLEGGGRLPVEAKILGLEIISNGNLPVMDEDWFGKENMIEVLKSRTTEFWKAMAQVTI